MPRTKVKKKIFENERVETLCIQFKRSHDWCTFQRICEETANLMDSIIRRSKFHLKAPFEDIRQHLFSQMERWVERWIPGKGRFYTYASTSLTGDTKVMLADGTYMRLDEIVDGRLEIMVKALDPTTGKLVDRRVVGWHRNPVPDRSVWRRVSVAAPGGRMVHVNLTHDHELYTGGDGCAHQPGSERSWTVPDALGGVTLAHIVADGKPVPCPTTVGRPSIEDKWKYDITVDGDTTRNFLVEGDGPRPTPVIVANCIKYGAISFVTREKTLNDRVAFTDKPLEALSSDPSTQYEMNTDSDVIMEVVKRVEKIRVRWQEPIVREVLKFTICAVVSGRAAAHRRAILTSITLGWPEINQDTAKFLLDWSVGAVRAAILDVRSMPLSETDVARAADRYSFIPDIVGVVGWDKTKQLMHLFAGVSVRFPSVTQIQRHNTLQRAYEEVNRDPSPENVAVVAKKLRVSPDRLQKQIEGMQDNICAGALSDQPLFSDGEFPKEVVAAMAEG